MDDVFKTALQKTMPGRFKQKELAEKVDISVSYFNDLYKGRKSGQENLRRAIALALGYDDYEAFLDVGRRELGMKTLRQTASSSDACGPDERQGFFRVPFSKQSRLVGGALEISADEAHSPVVIHGPSLGRANARNLQAFKVSGDEMEPLIGKDGVVLVDLSQNDFRGLREKGIYLICWDLVGGQCFLRRLTWVEKGRLLAIEPENGSYETIYKRAAEARLIGRVIWSGREHI